jgi:hypothetical protein
MKSLACVRGRGSAPVIVRKTVDVDLLIHMCEIAVQYLCNVDLLPVAPVIRASRITGLT